MAALNFGALTDHFGLATAVLVLVDSSLTPVAESVTRAENQDGDFEDEELTGQNADGDLADISCTYEVQTSSINLNTLEVGELVAGTIAGSLVCTTASGAWPRIVVTGQFNTETVVAPASFTNKWSIPDSIVITAAKRAQLMSFAIDAGCRCTGSSYSAAVDIASTPNGLGVIAAHGVSGGVATQTADLVRITAACAWTPTGAGGWSETQQAGATEAGSGFHTTSVAAEKILDRDAA